VTDPSAIDSIDVVQLYRPVGKAELDLIAGSDFHRFPPRLPHQPIFYPVASQTYAMQIARDWNTKDEASGFEGHVTAFVVRRSFLSSYRVRTVGSAAHQEYWIPAEDLPAFNDSIVGQIRVVATFRDGTHAG
jgi:hypothetical protein